MRRMLMFSFIFSVPLAVLAFSGITHAAVEFAADMVIAPRGVEPMKAKIFVKDDKVRQETSNADETQVMIVLLDKKMMWMIMPEGKTYTEEPYQAAGKTFEEWTADKEKNAKFLGEETVSGIPCKKYAVIEDGERMVFWLPVQFPIPVRIENSEITIEYQNIQLGPLDDSLFELPAGYEKIAAPVVSQEE
jgi:outer membrane lipoprotein-sorting protein